MTNPSNIPVIVGIGEVIDRECEKEPRQLIVEAAKAAAQDAPGFLENIDRLDVVNVYSWVYEDIAGNVADDLGISPASKGETVAGGEKPIRLIGEAAEDIAKGKITTALICGGEANRTRGQFMKSGETPDWGPAKKDAKQLTALDFVTPLAARYSLLSPPSVYPLYENATRKVWGQRFEEAQEESAILWGRYSEAAAENPYAWIPRKHDAAAITSPENGNRMISYPYRKLMVANPSVNQGAAILVTSLAAAREANIPEERLVFIGSGARANEPSDFLSRDTYERSAVQDTVLGKTLADNDLAAQEIDLFELYSCFPTVPKMARRTLGLGDDIKPSVAGGLTFFGGPANNFMTHAVAAAVRKMRANEGETALLYGQGEYVTKHAAIALSKSARFDAPAMHDVQQQSEDAAGPAPELLESYEGPATIESFAMNFDRDGSPKVSPVICRSPDGARVVTYADMSEELLDLLTSKTGEPIGAAGKITKNEKGLLIFSL